MISIVKEDFLKSLRESQNVLVILGGRTSKRARAVRIGNGVYNIGALISLVSLISKEAAIWLEEKATDEGQPLLCCKWQGATQSSSWKLHSGYKVLVYNENGAEIRGEPTRHKFPNEAILAVNLRVDLNTEKGESEDISSSY